MASSSTNEKWYQQTAASQIRTERLDKAELLNGRVAMIGLVIGLLTEAISGSGIVKQVTYGFFGCN